MRAIFLGLLVVCACLAVDFSNLKNSRVVTTVDLTEQIVKLNHDILVETVGAPASTYYFALDKQSGPHASSVTAVDQMTDEDLEVDFVSPPSAEQDYYLYKVRANLPNSPKASLLIVVSLTHALQPLPAEITQQEHHRVKFQGNHLFYSPYPTASTKTVIQFAEGGLIGNSKLEPVVPGTKDLTYGPYINIPAFSSSPMSVHVFITAPFLAVRDVTRHVEVSHWGNIAIEESYNVYHAGAKLKDGLFSRISAQLGQPTPTMIGGFTLYLPKTAADVYYRDEIGNITTSAYIADSDPQVVELRPRFPLFGGWHTEFKFGYNVPASQYLTSVGSKYTLTVPFVGEWKDKVVFDHVDVRIVLPEGAKNVVAELPFDAATRHESLATYLDVGVGRPVVVISKGNLNTDHHQKSITVTYEFSSSSLLVEPLLLVAFFFSVLVVIMLLSRVNLRLYPEQIQAL